MQHSFDISIAKIYGVNVAVFLNNIAFWIHKNVSNNKHFYDGYHWTYNSQDAFTHLFPYWTRQNLRTVIKKSVDEYLVKTGNYNETKYDRTSWYAFTEKGLELFPILKTLGCNQPMELMKPTTSLVRINQPIPDSKTDIKTDKRAPSPVDKSSSSRKKPARKRHAPLSVDFVFDELNSQACIAKNIDIDHVLSKFKAHMASSGKKSADWQAEAKLWIERERAISTNSVKKPIPEGEAHSAVPAYCPGHPRWETLHGNKGIVSHGSDISRNNTRGTGVRQAKDYLL